MARSVFYSFHYQNDITRVMVVRNRWLTQGGQMISGVIDHAEFEQVQRRGDFAIKKWISDQLLGTSVTVVLIDEETLKREYVKYEICKSLQRRNAIIGVDIHRIKDLHGRTSLAGNYHAVIGYYDYGHPMYFDDVATAIYDYVYDDGYNNLGQWVENAAE